MDFEVFSRLVVIGCTIGAVVSVVAVIIAFTWKSKQQRHMRFKIYDNFHGTSKGGWVYSDNSLFDGKVSEFFAWVEQHQGNYDGVKFAGWRVKDG
jgi:hypothetical protein